MTKAYKKYLKKHVSKNKRYAIVNIGDNNKPALLIGSSNTMDYAGNGKYFGCSVYYYQNGKIKKVCGFSGARRISLRKKNKKYYIYTGASDVSENLRIQKGKAYKAGYYNCHKKIPEDCWKKSKITLGKKTIKNYGTCWRNANVYRGLLLMILETTSLLSRDTPNISCSISLTIRSAERKYLPQFPIFSRLHTG